MRYLPLLILVAHCGSVFQKVPVQSSSAVCLDGSSAVFYMAQGDPNKVLIYFQSGGWCGMSTLTSSLDTCLSRSQTDLGSSKRWPQTHDMGRQGSLSGDPSMNPIFYNWTRVYFSYCDGTGHQGHKASPVSYKGANLYFRGADVTLGRLDTLNKTIGLFTRDQIAVVGGSAGGLAAYYWVDYIRENSIGNVFGIPDSGIFLDVRNFETGNFDYRSRIMNVAKLGDEWDPPNKACVAANQNEKWKCLMAQYIIPFVKSPIFIIQSLYDSYSIPSVLGVNCIDDDLSISGCTP